MILNHKRHKRLLKVKRRLNSIQRFLDLKTHIFSNEIASNFFFHLLFIIIYMIKKNAYGRYSDKTL